MKRIFIIMFTLSFLLATGLAWTGDLVIDSGGIINLNHQSRTRWELSTHQAIPAATWTPIPFDVIVYDEHTESTSGIPGAEPVSWVFTAAQKGYYQVNARTHFDLDAMQPVQPGPINNTVSISIFVNDAIHSQGNSLQVASMADTDTVLLPGNNAPNVSDIVFLNAGDTLEIHVWQSTGTAINIVMWSDQTYVSVHKLS